MTSELVQKLKDLTLREFNKEFKQELWKDIIRRHEELEPVIDEALRLTRKEVEGYIDACLDSKSVLVLLRSEDFREKVGMPKSFGDPGAEGYYIGVEGTASWIGQLERYWFDGHLTFETPQNEVLELAEIGRFRLGLGEIAEMSSKWDVSDSYSEYAISCGCNLPVLQRQNSNYSNI